ncbi:hypothetical protein M409DRAFT_68921 [Zasmidium cellare ATCC 36951]|uniref:DUF998 domain-containing protein n=1 Tax=Zasmidium cellare ATCC 36951 TaxID=1080233 RepID=A0A6A6C9M9_ZASCE|nr:uncharacterized protein M409DRAFT_68921 [Zasmidium cellare ATCC 36951]KAF2162602.1 hypothetical protein M409DRAFT_68921 [Zasmidium cellare ATCC 36951]
MPPQTRTPLLPTLLLIAAPLTWPIFEYYSIQGFAHSQPTYNILIESLTDLGINYRQVHELKHYNVTSLRHGTINFLFLLAGTLFGLAQLGLFWGSRHRATTQGLAFVRRLRTVLTLVYVAGMVLFAQVHGGPRERVWKIAGWHWMGLGMAAIAGNLNSILVAAVPAQVHEVERSVVYRVGSGVLGTAGLYSFYRWAFTLGEWNYLTQLGLWERGCFYPVLAWEALAGVAFLVGRFGGGDGVAKGKGKRA